MPLNSRTLSKATYITHVHASFSETFKRLPYWFCSQLTSLTFSVANTVKRGLLIWLSVMTFGNQVSLLSWIGTSLVISGVFLYNEAKKKTALPRTAVYVSTDYIVWQCWLLGMSYFNFPPYNYHDYLLVFYLIGPLKWLVVYSVTTCTQM